MFSIEQIKKDLQDVIDTQCSDGNWNYDPYMHGMANGLIVARSILTGEEPVFLEAPKKWLSDVPMRNIESSPCEDSP